MGEERGLFDNLNLKKRVSTPKVTERGLFTKKHNQPTERSISSMMGKTRQTRTVGEKYGTRGTSNALAIRQKQQTKWSYNRHGFDEQNPVHYYEWRDSGDEIVKYQSNNPERSPTAPSQELAKKNKSGRLKGRVQKRVQSTLALAGSKNRRPPVRSLSIGGSSRSPLTIAF